MEDMEKLLEILKEIDEEIDFANETALIDDGVIDSMTLTQIIVALDEAFDVRIVTGEIEPENFNSARSMLELVRQYQEKK